MPRRPSQQLTEAELRLMNVLWDRERGTVGEIADAVDAEKPIAYNSVLTTLRILENKGFVRHTKQSRAFVYEPLIGREEASGGAVRHLLTRFFNDSPALLVANLLKDERIRKRDREQLRKLIEEDRQEKQKNV
ncbi:MAG TPA: BlaI/MecI/CopY family transcriptional regulator [Bryobacteraceae bacterium]|jgi:predicted transcriptional regulator|nr:BlaI/MecI/CopY family transcriptional regulator [Bryobacteraceae bacterium]